MSVLAFMFLTNFRMRRVLFAQKLEFFCQLIYVNKGKYFFKQWTKMKIYSLHVDMIFHELHQQQPWPVFPIPLLAYLPLQNTKCNKLYWSAKFTFCPVTCKMKTKNYLEDGNKGCCLVHSHKQAVFDLQKCSSRLKKPNGGGAHDLWFQLQL